MKIQPVILSLVVAQLTKHRNRYLNILALESQSER